MEDKQDQTVKPKRKRQKKGDVHYVNNKEFTAALHEYSLACQESEEKGTPKPQMSNYLGSCVIKMANRLATTPRFSGYIFKEDMIQNGILGAMKYMHRFNGKRFNNGFAYVTQILFSHFIVTIKNEKKRYEGNMRMIQEAESGLFGSEEFEGLQEAHARSIADQKLKDISDAKEEKGVGGFQLRTGYTKEARDSYKGGTPMDEYLDEDEKDG